MMTVCKTHSRHTALRHGVLLACLLLGQGGSLQAADNPFAMEEAPGIPGYEPSTNPRDISGLWSANRVPGLLLPFYLGSDLPFTASARERYDYAIAMSEAGTQLATPHIMCRPTGINQATGPIAPVYVLQNDEKLVFTVMDEIRELKQVYFADSHPADMKPSYTGDAIAHWEGNELVIETIGYNGRGVLENVVHSEDMRMTQRIRKSADGKTLDIDITLEDPEIFTEPVELKRSWRWVNGQQPIEFDCEENPREDNFSGMLFEEEYLRPVCIQHEGEGEELSKVVCTRPED